MITYTLKVDTIRQETLDTITLCFKQPGLKKIRYIAGQYLTLIFRINGRRYIRPYSFSSAPLIDSLIEITIKRVQNGIVSNHIHDTIKIGDSIQAMQPMGDFIFNSQDNICDQVFFWGVGSGITPLISLIKQILNDSSGIVVNLAYGNQNEESTIFSGLIHTLSLKYPSRFKVIHFHTKYLIANQSPFVVQGRITKDSVLSMMRNIKAETSLHYICGPYGLKESVKEVLAHLHVPAANIHAEDFELVKNPEDFVDIHTQSVQLKFEGDDYILEVVKGKSILESALDAGIELPYSCQTGNCSTCKANLKSGSLKMIGLAHKREDLAEDEYLLCCSHPLTDSISIEL